MPPAAWISSFAAIAIVSGIPLLVTLLMAFRAENVRAAIPYLTAFGAGALMGAAVLHLIPEALKSGMPTPAVFISVAAGYAAFALVEWMLASHDHAHAHGLELGAPENHHEHSTGALVGASSAGNHSPSVAGARALVPLAFAGDAVHNLVDGVLIAAGFLANPAFGMLTAVAIGLHELPRELGTYGLFVHSGVHPLRAVWYNLITAAVSLVGASATLLIGARLSHFGEAVVPIAAGSYIYISVAIGKPALSARNPAPGRTGRFAAVLLGAAAMGASALLG